MFALRGESAATWTRTRAFTLASNLWAVCCKRQQNREPGCRAARDADVQQAIQASDRWSAFRVLRAKRQGVFVVRLHEAKLVDHAVVVDANSGVIIYSEESTALVLASAVLQRCGGENGRNLRVIEVRAIATRD